jgi:hypothetical protein
MLRFAVAAVLCCAATAAAAAQDFHLVRWKKSGLCDVVTALPLFGGHWTELGVYPTRRQADTALGASRRTRQCPPAPKPRDGEG